MPKSYDHDDEVTAEIDTLDDDDDNSSEPTQVASAPPYRPRNVGHRQSMQPTEVSEPPRTPPPSKRSSRHSSPTWDEQLSPGHQQVANPMPQHMIIQPTPPPPPPRQYYFDESRSGN